MDFSEAFQNSLDCIRAYVECHKKFLEDMKRIKRYDNKTIVAHIPTLAEAQKHYEETGEFIISANQSDLNEGYEGEDVNEALENNGVSVIDKVELGIRESDPRNVIQPTPKPVAEPAPAPAEPAPSE